MDLIKKLGVSRRATKVFNNEKIDEDIVKYILECAQTAPSSIGLESTRYLVIRNEKTKSEISEYMFHNSEKVKMCSDLVLFITKTSEGLKSDWAKKEIKDLIERKFDEPNYDMVDVLHSYITEYKIMPANSDYTKDKEQSLTEWAARQAYTQLGYMMLAAEEKGVSSLPIEGYDPILLKKYLKDLGYISNDEFISVALLLGKKGDNPFQGKHTRRSFDKNTKIIK